MLRFLSAALAGQVVPARLPPSQLQHKGPCRTISRPRRCQQQRHACPWNLKGGTNFLISGFLELTKENTICKAAMNHFCGAAGCRNYGLGFRVYGCSKTVFFKLLIWKRT